MTKTALGIIGIVVLALIGAAFVYQSSTSGTMQGTNAAMIQKEEAGMLKADADSMEMMDKGGDDTMMDDGAMKKDDAMMKKDSMMQGETKKDGSMMAHGSYEAYAPEKLALANSGDVVLFFRASWCPTCKAVDSDIRSKSTSIPGGLTILDVDYDNSSDLKKKYGVTYQHTFVQVSADGSLIKKWSGSPTLAALVAQVQ